MRKNTISKIRDLNVVIFQHVIADYHALPPFPRYPFTPPPSHPNYPFSRTVLSGVYPRSRRMGIAQHAVGWDRGGVPPHIIKNIFGLYRTRVKITPF